MEVTARQILERTYERITTFGWWGTDGVHSKYSHKQHDEHCKCLALHIDHAMTDLGIEYGPERNTLLKSTCSTLLSVVDVSKIEQAKEDPFWNVTRWNDQPSRHVATVKRAVKRAIKAAA